MPPHHLHLQIERLYRQSGLTLSISNPMIAAAKTSTQAISSHVTAGKEVTITATGAGKDSDLNIIGSQITAGNNVSLAADNTINLKAAQNTATLNSSNKSSSASIGASISSTGGITGNLAMSKGRGSANGQDISYTETIVQSGSSLSLRERAEGEGKTTLQSGHDTNIIGSQVIGNQIIANVGFPSPPRGRGSGRGGF